MHRILGTLVGSLLLAMPFVAHGTEESCPVGGITARWAISYCMARFETDDEAHPGVSECFVDELEQNSVSGPEEDCESNIAYKSAICSMRIASGTYQGSLAECVASDEMIPSVVTNGIG